MDKKSKEKEDEKKREGMSRRERERERKKRGFRFSLRSTEIGSSVFVGARDKVLLHDESSAWV